MNTVITFLLTTTWVSALFFGTGGAIGRILLQRWSNKEWPHATWQGYVVSMTLGLIGGWFSYELTKYIDWNFGNLGAFVVGWFFPDIAENLMEGFKPPIGD